MRVLMVLGRSTGGIGTHVTDLSARLRGLGDEVEIVTDPLTAERFGLPDAHAWWPGRRSGLVGSIRGLRSTRRLAASADVVHAHGHQAGLLAALVTAGLSVPLVVSQHNALLEHRGGRQLVGRLAQRLVARRARLVTGASTDLAQTAAALGAGHTELAEVPSPRVPDLLAVAPADATTRTDQARELLAEHGIPSERPLVLTISRIAPQKSLETLVDAASRATQPAAWVVIGEGDPELLASLREQAGARSAPVHFVGHVTDPSPWLRAAEVFVLPSQWEARALVVQEAMAAGVPVVATDTGGLRDLVGDVGILVPVVDAAAVAEAVDRLLSDPALRESLATAARKVAASWDDGEATARRWHQWYAALLPMT